MMIIKGSSKTIGFSRISYATKQYLKKSVLPEVIKMRKLYNDYPMEFKYWNIITTEIEALCKGDDQ